jgi:hypothetical protein
MKCPGSLNTPTTVTSACRSFLSSLASFLPIGDWNWLLLNFAETSLVLSGAAMLAGGMEFSVFTDNSCQRLSVCLARLTRNEFYKRKNAEIQM